MCRSLPLGRKLQQEWPRDGPSGKPFHSAHSAAFTLVSVCSLILMRGSPPGMGGRQGSVTAGSRGGSAAGGEARRLACSQEQRQAAGGGVGAAALAAPPRSHGAGSGQRLRLPS